MRNILYIRFILLVFLTLPLHAEWVFVNNDGTFSAYNSDEVKSNVYIPLQDKQDDLILQNEQNKVKKRKIIATKRVATKREDSSRKTIYLTFDDGPLNGTQNILSVLDELGTYATMFVIGRHATQTKYRKNLFHQALNMPNILVANHTYNHANGHYHHFYSSVPRVLKDLNNMDKLLQEEDPSYQSKYCRLAGRNVFRVDSIKRNDSAIRSPREYRAYDALAQDGFKIYGWDYQWSYRAKDGKPYKSPKQMVDVIEYINKKHRTRKRDKVILLMHDFCFKNKFHGKENLRELIALLDARGWQFETLENY